MTLPERCKQCTHYDDGQCHHSDPFPGVLKVVRGEYCESFDQNYDMDEAIARFEADFERAWETALQLQLPED